MQRASGNTELGATDACYDEPIYGVIYYSDFGYDIVEEEWDEDESDEVEETCTLEMYCPGEQEIEDEEEF